MWKKKFHTIDVYKSHWSSVEVITKKADRSSLSMNTHMYIVSASFSGLFSLKTKYDESDNVMVRATRVVTDKLQDVFSKRFNLYLWFSQIYFKSYYFNVRKFRVQKISRFSRMTPKFAKLNGREKNCFAWFAKINPKKYIFQISLVNFCSL